MRNRHRPRTPFRSDLGHRRENPHPLDLTDMLPRQTTPPPGRAPSARPGARLTRSHDERRHLPHFLRLLAPASPPSPCLLLRLRATRDRDLRALLHHRAVLPGQRGRHHEALTAHVAPELRREIRREPRMRTLGELQLELLIGRSGIASNELVVIPFLIFTPTHQIHRDAFALQDQHDIGERRTTMGHQIRRAARRGSRGPASWRSRSRSPNPPDTTRGSPQTSLRGRPAGSSSAAPAAAWAASRRSSRCSPAPGPLATFTSRDAPFLLVVLACVETLNEGWNGRP